MISASLRPPNKRERDLKKQLEEARHRTDELMCDCTGKDTIKALEGQVEALTTEVAHLFLVKLDNKNLQDKNRALSELVRCYKKENASMKWDIKVAYSYEAELERKLEKESKRRYEWACLARCCKKTITELRAEVRYLRAKVNRNSDNSSIPPSACPNKKKILNSRVKSGRQPGAQLGHTGHKRRWRTPDETVFVEGDHACPSCGGALVAQGVSKTHQLHELVISVKTTEFIAQDHVCTSCGQHVHTTFPQGVENDVNYKNNIKTVATYLVNRCNVSIDNTIKFLYEASGHELHVSKGSVHNFMRTFSKRAKADLDDIAALIKASPLVGSDATYTTTNGKRTYLYTFNSESCALYQASEHKGVAPLFASPLADFDGIIVHDHDKAYYRFGGGHAECNVHILRYLKGVCENEPEKAWAPFMLDLLKQANATAKCARENKEEVLDLYVCADFESRYDAIIELARSEYASGEPINSKYRPEGIALSLRLEKYRNNHLAFLHDLRIPFDNNASERLLRGAKKKMKQSGGFRSMSTGQDYYCDYLSIIQTASMQDREVMGVVRDIFDNKGGMFKKTTAADSPADP